MKTLTFLAMALCLSAQSFAQDENIQLPENAFVNGATLTQALIKNADALSTSGDCETMTAKKALGFIYASNGVISLKKEEHLSIGRVVYTITKTNYYSTTDDENTIVSIKVNTNLDGQVVNNNISCSIAM